LLESATAILLAFVCNVFKIDKHYICLGLVDWQLILL